MEPKNPGSDSDLSLKNGKRVIFRPSATLRANLDALVKNGTYPSISAVARARLENDARARIKPIDEYSEGIRLLHYIGRTLGEIYSRIAPQLDGATSYRLAHDVQELAEIARAVVPQHRRTRPEKKEMQP